MSELIQGFMQADTSRGYSASVWRQCPLSAIRDKKIGVLAEDDFTTFVPTATDYSISGTSATVVPIQTVPGGVIQIACTNSANGESYLGYGIKLGSVAMIETNKPNQVWFETRIKVDDITSGVSYVGLAKPSDVAAAMWADTTLVPATTVSALGFRTLTGTKTSLDVFYMDDAAATVYKAGAATLATGTYVKLGIRFDGNNTGNTNTIHFFVNGVEVASTAGAMGVLSSATNFPDAIGLTPFWGTKTAASAAITMSVDWWRMAGTIQDATYDAP